MRGDTLMQEWPDGHKLFLGGGQWTVRHNHKCKNAKRGIGNNFAYAKETYFRQKGNMEAELRTCQVAITAA